VAKRTGIMLAYKFDEGKFRRMPKPVVVQPKLNGNRCRAVFDNEGKVILLSSSATPITSVNHIGKQLLQLNIKNLELDGELYIHGMPHQKINAIVRRTTTVHAERDKIKYTIFDLAHDTLDQQSRFTVINGLQDRAKLLKLTHINFLEGYIVPNMTEVMRFLGVFMARGYEGIIIRNLAAKYVRKRSVDLLKYKPMIEGSYKIVGWKQGVSKVCRDCYSTPSKCECLGGPLDVIETPTAKLGAIECITLEGEKFHIGSGKYFTDKRRYALWTHREKLIGLSANTKYQELSEDLIPKMCVLLDIPDAILDVEKDIPGTNHV